MTATAASSQAPRTIIEVENVSKSFSAADGSTLSVLENVSVTLRDGEIVAILGRSGSGKSTLLRTIAGLIAPTSGEVRYRGTPLHGANPGVAMVFQSFALMPWLTVQANVELGLQAQGVPAAERRERALKAIDVIGLDGFESAYPKELSGGMRQRVGFARALVLNPDALLMDEPFSALDVLTAENLRNEVMGLWAHSDFTTSAVCIVTHNIEEAVLMADRVLVLGSNPGRVRTEVAIDLPRPRDRRSSAFEAVVDKLYSALTGREAEETSAPTEARSPLTHRLPDVTPGGLAGLAGMIFAAEDGVDLADLAAALSFEIDDLLPLVDAAVMLGLAETREGRVNLTDTGKRWYTSGGIQDRKVLFAEVVSTRAPLVHTIVKALRSSDDGTLRDDFFLDLLRRGYSAEDAQQQLNIAIGWGRYAELFDYDAITGEIELTPAVA